MKQTRILMGMPVTVEVVEARATAADLQAVFAYFEYVDAKFSTYKETSEISAINRRELTLAQASADMQTIFALAQQTRAETNGFFDIERNGRYDPSGLVKGWAIRQAADLLRQRGFEDYYVEAGGDIQAAGWNDAGQPWRVGIRNPFNLTEIVKVIAVSEAGVATSGTYARGQHIYSLQNGGEPLTDVVSLTVIGPDIYEADRFATAAFAMGRDGIWFIEDHPALEGYQIDAQGQAVLTTGF
jgi:thiamine biosynthesis lipoprotein